MSTRTFTFSFLALIALVTLSGQALATVYAQVGTCTPPNPPANTYTTIQLAVTNSAPGTVIQICPGIYPEQVAISKRLTLIGVGNTTNDAAVIVPPTGGVIANATDTQDSHAIGAQVFVHDTFAASVMITNLTVDGIGNKIAGCAPDLMGILFQNASGTMNHLAVRNQVSGDVLSGCQEGKAIWVESGTGKTSKVTVQNSSVHNYNKDGITGRYAGTTLNLVSNYIQGAGLDPNAPAQNGIELAFGATGSITIETVIDNNYAGDPSNGTASGILLYSAANGAMVNKNIVGNSQTAIGLFDADGVSDDGITVNGNHIFGTATFDAIDVCSNGNTITGNTIVNSGQSGIHLDSSCGGTGKNNVATGNTFLESACAGIIDDWSGGGGNSYGTETYWTIPFPLTGSAGSCPFVSAPTVVRAQGKRRIRASE